MIYAYGITDPSTEPPALEGIEGAPTRAIDAGGVRAVSSVVASAPRPEGTSLLSHERVIEAVMARGAVLPARFGTCFARESDLIGVLRRHGLRLARALDEVAGHVELGVRVCGETPDFETPDPETAGDYRPTGRDYLRALAAQERAGRAAKTRAQAVADKLHPLLTAEASAAHLEVLPDARTLMAGAYLVPSGRADRFQRLAEDLATYVPGLALHQSGPWPPYSFAPSLDEEAVSVQ